MYRKLASRQGKITDSDFHNAISIGDKIEALHKTDNLTYFESCVEVAEILNIEIETLAKMLPKAIKDKLLAEASDLRLLKTQYRINTLPL